MFFCNRPQGGGWWRGRWDQDLRERRLHLLHPGLLLLTVGDPAVRLSSPQNGMLLYEPDKDEVLVFSSVVSPQIPNISLALPHVSSALGKEKMHSCRPTSWET